VYVARCALLHRETAYAGEMTTEELFAVLIPQNISAEERAKLENEIRAALDELHTTGKIVSMEGFYARLIADLDEYKATIH
jgi:hypothetical protein